MRKITFSDSLLIAACLHGITIFSLSPRHVPKEPPPLAMLHVKIGTNFGNSEHAQATSVKTLVAAAPHLEKPHDNQVLPNLEPAAGEPVVPPLKVDGKFDQIPSKQEQFASNTPITPPSYAPPSGNGREKALPATLPSHVEPPLPSSQEEQRLSAIGSPLGDAVTPDAKNMIRYEQILAIWINKFRQYPLEAKEKNQEGTAVLRVVIDRNGSILHYGLTQKTGFTLLDDAVLEMAKKANPVPAAPENYASDDEMEFQIPVRFLLGGE